MFHGPRRRPAHGRRGHRAAEERRRPIAAESRRGEIDRRDRIACRRGRDFRRRLGAGGSAGRQRRSAPPPRRLRARMRAAVWFPSSPLKAIRARAPQGQVEFNAGTDPAAAAAWPSSRRGHRLRQPADERRPRRRHLLLPDNQDALVARWPRPIRDHRGAGNRRPGRPCRGSTRCSAVLEAWFPGIRGAEAIANILFGDVNPSAKLPVTFAKSDADLPHPQIAGIDACRLRPRAPPGAAAGGRGGCRPSTSPTTKA